MAIRGRAGNLTAALVVVSLLELLVNRLANRLFLPRSVLSGGSGSTLGRLVGDSGPFLFHLAGVLALVILLLAFGGLLRRGELFPRSVRFTVAVIGAVFWLLAVLALLFGRLPPRFALHIETSFAFLSLLIGVSFVRSAVKARIKLGVMLVLLPGIIHVVAIVCERTGWGRGMAVSVTLLTHVAEVAMLLATAAAPALFSPRPWRQRRQLLPLVAAALTTTVFVIGLATRFDLLSAAGLYGLRMELPRPGTVAGLAYVVALFGWVYAVTQLLLDKGGMRLVGYGLILLALAGYQAVSPVESSIALVGLLAIAVGELRAVEYGDSARPGPMEWREYVGRVASAASDAPGPDGSRPEAVIVEEGEQEISRIRAYRRGRPVAIKFLRRRGQVVEYEAVVGEPGRSLPDATIERHHSWLAKSPAEKLPLPRSRTGDVAFDQKFSVHGKAPLDSDGMRRQLMRQGDGMISLWHGTSARYRALADGAAPQSDLPLRGLLQGHEPIEAVVADLDTLVDLIETSATG